jgi:L-amino acid N-acyltransferase YncA
MVTLRRAVPDDEARLLTWRNDPITRESSFDQDEISCERKLADPACAILIAEEKGQSVGQLRLDRAASYLAEVHITVAPEARGHGVGREILALAVRDAQILIGVTHLRALVKRSNTASLRAFRAAGFQETGEDAGMIEFLRAAL